MNQKTDGPLAWLRKRALPFFRARPFLATAGALVFSLTVILANLSSGIGGGNPDAFEVGKVAERDVIAESSVTYEDEEASRQRLEAQEKMVPAVFQYSSRVSEEALNSWNRFFALVETAQMDLTSESSETFIAEMEKNFPEYFSPSVLELLYQNPMSVEILNGTFFILASILETGVYLVPHSSTLENYNSDVLELVRHSGNRVERERISYESIVTREKIPEALDYWMASSSMAHEDFYGIMRSFSMPFLVENVFFSPEETVQRLMETRSKIEPVMKYIERGQRVIKKGFIITEEDMVVLRALNRSRGNDMGNMVSIVLLLLLLFFFMIIFFGKRITGRSLTDPEIYLTSILSAIYFAGTALTRNLYLGSASMPVSILIPTALMVMLPSILIHPRLAFALAFALPLGAFFSNSFDVPSFIFALASGITASFILQGAEKRMDLVKAGLIIAGANVIAMTAILLSAHAEAGAYPGSLFWAAFNGIASSMLVLGFLPPLEHALNAATSFRLLELSDLNAPILRRLFAAAPGTYSHSIMVANLAESACQAIGANALLARVGAYYHDLGKMGNPNYFVENQTDYNPHDDMVALLSATIIRSHVKLGVEKARQLGLPRELIDIIAEHHGNSVITWFYSKALKQVNQNSQNGKKVPVNGKMVPVNIEDFRYQGNPPRSRESAVVMLADLTEAAIRSLDKPTPAKIEKFFQELLDSKIEHGQLARSELTFHDLEIIKKAFIHVLTGHYHSRITYPKIETPKAQDLSDEAPNTEAVQ
jgi:putative nucleotidyltransferase with HDIG domain